MRPRPPAGRGRHSRAGAPRPRSAPSVPRVGSPVAEKIFQMPTVAEVVASGYPAERWHEIKKQRDELVRRFDTDAAFRTDVLARVARGT